LILFIGLFHYDYTLIRFEDVVFECDVVLDPNAASNEGRTLHSGVLKRKVAHVSCIPITHSPLSLDPLFSFPHMSLSLSLSLSAFFVGRMGDISTLCHMETPLAK
jgi:hypothetical protein